jgi:hypothetical protein
MAVAEAASAAEDKTAVQQFLFPDKEELPDGKRPPSGWGFGSTRRRLQQGNVRGASANCGQQTVFNPRSATPGFVSWTGFERGPHTLARERGHTKRRARFELQLESAVHGHEAVTASMRCATLRAAGASLPSGKKHRRTHASCDRKRVTTYTKAASTLWPQHAVALRRSRLACVSAESGGRRRLREGSCLAGGARRHGDVHLGALRRAARARAHLRDH